MHRIVRCLLPLAFVSVVGCSGEGRIAADEDVPAAAGSGLQNAPVEVLGYSETAMYEVLNNLPAGSGLVYSIPGATFTTPIMRRGQVIEHRDGEDGPTLTFSRDGMVATLAGTFVDRWVRVE